MYNVRKATGFLAINILLLGCEVVLDEKTANFIQDTQKATSQGCSIIPAAKAIVSLSSILFPNILPASAALQTASEICSAYLGGEGPSPVLTGNTVEFEVRGVKIDARILE